MYWRTNTYLLVEWAPLEYRTEGFRVRGVPGVAQAVAWFLRAVSNVGAQRANSSHTGWLLARRPLFFGPGQPIGISASFNNGTVEREPINDRGAQSRIGEGFRPAGE
jgi:hypothetical protein